MKCMSQEREIIKETGKKGDFCKQDAMKQCRHKHMTCKKHFHGCKNEEELPLD